jgi:beta-mannosidase
MHRQTLHDGWRLSTAEGSVPARVPGTVHLDLLAAGRIPDPYLDRVEEELAWMHRENWRYTLSFEADAAREGERVDLAFDGLDTLAVVELNGRTLGETANMHRSHRFDVREVLRSGTNELVVDFRSALEYVERSERELGPHSRTYPHAFSLIRKMACSFGWDWGPDLQTAGIWKPVRLERWHEARISRLRPLVTVAQDGSGRVEVHAEIERAGLGGGGELTLAARLGSHEARAAVPVSENSATAVLDVPNVSLWWPHGYGDQPLHDLTVELCDVSDDGLDAADRLHVLDSATRRIGFRTVTVDVAPDELGTPFTIVVNGRPVFVKGANWIPDDHFLTRVTRDRLARRVDQALGAHVNMLRVWGGGIYETEDFYEVCDERGVLVWQDFPFACAAYPETDPLRAEIEAEVRENVSRLASHASLALWNGGNETMWGYCDWGWREQMDVRPWGHGYYTDLLPRLVAQLDPTRFYCANSPYNPHHPIDALHPNDENHGTRHEWQVWNTLDYTAYRDHIPRFCSEFGFQAPPTGATLRRWIRDEPLTPASPAFLLHQKADDGSGKLERGFAAHLPRPSGFTDWHWTTQLNQARAVAFGIEHFRSWWPRTAGAIVWQLNDCWPATSWSAIDGEGRPKPLWYALRRAYAPRLFTIQPREGRSVLIAINDTDTAWAEPISLERRSFDGEVKASTVVEIRVAPRSAIRIDIPAALLAAEDPKREALVAEAAEVRVVHTFLDDLEVAYEPRPVTAHAAAVDGGYEVRVHAHSLARDVSILADGLALDAEVDDMLVTLLPGETRTFLVRTAEALDPSRLTGPTVLRSANDLFLPTGPQNRADER